MGPCSYYTPSSLLTTSKVESDISSTFESLKGTNMFSFFSGSKAKGVALKPTSIHDIERDKSKTGRTLKHLIKLNHAEHAILFNDRKFHNHLPHVRAEACLLH